MLVAIAATCLPLGASEPPEPDQARVRASIQRMLDHGFKPGPAGLKAAEESYRAAAALLPDDPRLEYAWGLVLLRQFRHAEAAERFQTAAESPGDPLWPAWRALVWCRLAASQFEAGLEAIQAVSDRLRGDPEQERETAAWLGRTLAALEITTDAQPRKDRIVELDLQIRGKFPADLLQAYESGKPQTWQKHAKLLDEIDQLREQTIEKNAQAKDEQQHQVQAGLEKLSQQKQAVANTAGQWKEWFDEQTRRSDRQLIALKMDNDYLQRRAASVQRSLYGLGTEYTAREVFIRGRWGDRRPPTDFLRLQQEQQWLGYQVELLATFQQMQRVDRGVVGVVAKRQTAATRYAAAARQLARRQQALNSTAGRLLRKVAELDEQPLDRSAQLATKQMRVRKLSTYIPLDLDAERTRLLESVDAF